MERERDRENTKEGTSTQDQISGDGGPMDSKRNLAWLEGFAIVAFDVISFCQNGATFELRALPK